jgi:hypothetical protein
MSSTDAILELFARMSALEGQLSDRTIPAASLRFARLGPQGLPSVWGTILDLTARINTLQDDGRPSLSKRSAVALWRSISGQERFGRLATAQKVRRSGRPGLAARVRAVL